MSDLTRPSIEPRRVVITGLGAISSLANTADETWSRVVAGETGIRRNESLDPAQHPSVLHGSVDRASIPQRFLEPKEARNTSLFSKMALEAAGQALTQAGLLDANLELVMDLSAGGAAFGTCVGGTYDDLLPAHDTFRNRGPSRVPPHLHVMFPHNLAAYTVQHRFGLGGPSSTVVTACATGSQAIGDGFHAIKYGQAPLMVAGATESTNHPLFQAGFTAMRAVVTDSNDNPAGASRPFDATRAGFVLGRRDRHAGSGGSRPRRRRGVPTSSPKSLVSAPRTTPTIPIAPLPEVTGAARAIRAPFADAGSTRSDVDHINAHAASTPAGDVAEAAAINRVLRRHARDQHPGDIGQGRHRALHGGGRRPRNRRRGSQHRRTA